MHLNLIQREKLVADVLKHFGAEPFQYGKRDCGKMLIWHLRNAGHMIVADGDWSSRRGLLKWLRRNGGTGAGCLDGWGLRQIAPARLLPADIVEIDGSAAPEGAFGIALGNGRVIAYHEAVAPLAVIQPGKLKTAWSI